MHVQFICNSLPRTDKILAIPSLKSIAINLRCVVHSPYEFCCELGKVSTQQKLLSDLCLHLAATKDHVSVLDKPMNSILFFSGPL